MAKLDPVLLNTVLAKLDQMIGLIETNIQRLSHRAGRRNALVAADLRGCAK